MNAAWTYLLLAGLCEIGWPLGFKLSQATRFKLAFILAAAVSMALSGVFLYLAQRHIPIGTAYAVWTGIGAAGTFLIGGTEAHTTRSLPALLLPILAVGAALALVPLWLGHSRVLMGVAVLGLAFACYVIGFNVIFGSTGQLFLCVGALAGVGGFGATILADNMGLPIILSILVATLAATLTGGLLSFVAVKRSLGVIFTGIVTLVFSLAFTNLLFGQRDLTGAEAGLILTAARSR